MRFLKSFWKFYKSLGNKGHFLLPILGAVATAIGHGAATIAPAALGALKAVGGAALTGAKALGGGIAGAAKGILGGAQAVGSGVGKFGSSVLNSAKGMLGGGQGTQVATAMGKPVTFGQTVQGAGQVFNPATGALEAGKSNSMLNTLLKSIGSMKKEETAKAETPAQQDIIGGEGPTVASQIPQFRQMPSYGQMIMALLQKSRGF